MLLTTADCKKFLAEIFTRHPALIVDIYGKDALSEAERTRLLKDAHNPEKWKRESKATATFYFEEHSGVGNKTKAGNAVHVYPEGKAQPMLVADIVNVRKFVLDPKEYDTAVAFLVFEDKGGVLHLGEYSGD